MTHAPEAVPLPDGFGLVLDRSVRTFHDGRVLAGGHPGRLIALTGTGADALRRWLGGEPPSPDLRRLGRRLVDAGMAHPVAPAAAAGRAGVTVVVPARDRPESLDRCLGSVAGSDRVADRVVVVDDGSLVPEAVAEVSTRHGATLIRRPVNGGPGAARNDGLASVATELVAFLDSDCEVSPGWLDRLVVMFADPELAAVAPRVRPRPAHRGARRTALDRYAEGRSPLDMGPEPGEVGPGRVVGYVPSAALVTRLAALEGGFDRRLRVGEDVDLVWRLVESGWRVRYEPSVTVVHDEPASWSGLLRRRLRYGTSAGPLALRHPGRLAPVELRIWPAAVAAALVAGHPVVALTLLAGSSAATAGPLRRHGVPWATSARWSALGAGWTLLGVGRALTVLGGPTVLIGALRSRRWGATLAALVVAPPVVEWWRRRPPLDPVRWTMAAVADDMAYGMGVWSGCLRARSFRPLLPTVRLGGAGRTTGDPEDG